MSSYSPEVAAPVKSVEFQGYLPLATVLENQAR